LAVGDEAKLENSDEICRRSFTCVRIVAHAFLHHSAKRLAAIRVNTAQMFGVELNRCERVLDLVRHLAGISAQASRRCVRSSSPRCRCRSPAMLLKASTRRRSSSDEVAVILASRSPRAMRLVARVRRLTGSEIRSAM
jgi:hypothetical protein